MSGLFDSNLVVSVGSTPTLIYQPDTDGVTMSCLLSNNFYGTLPLTVWIDRADAIVNLAPGVRVESGQSYEVLVGSKVALKAGDKLYAQCPQAGAFTGVLSAYKDQ
jgi:hypothetical protein